MPSTKGLNLFWNEKNKRWTGKYKSKSYAISCRQLGVPQSKSASIARAMAWWTEKKKQIEEASLDRRGLLEALSHLYDNQVSSLAVGNLRAAAYWGKLAKQLDKAFKDAHFPDDVSFDPESSLFDMGAAEFVASPVVAAAICKLHMMLWQSKHNADALVERLQLDTEIASKYLIDEPEQTSSKIAVEQYIDRKRLKGVTEQHVSELRRCLSVFLDFFGEHTSIALVNEKIITQYFAYVGKQSSDTSAPKRRCNWSPNYVKHLMDNARRFIRWCHKQALISSLPKNLDDLTVPTQFKEIRVLSVDEVTSILEKLDGRRKLHILLMLNCGMTQKDVADLRHEEVDWGDGRVIRKRSKTYKYRGAPTISYLLWPETFSLLSLFRSSDPDRVLLNEDGKPLRWDETRGTKYTRSDSIRCFFVRFAKKEGLAKGLTLKHLRKTGATMIAAKFNETLADYYLAHSPRTIAQKHYIKADQAKFDEAVTWLGRELKIISD